MAHKVSFGLFSCLPLVPVCVFRFHTLSCRFLPSYGLCQKGRIETRREVWGSSSSEGKKEKTRHFPPLFLLLDRKKSVCMSVWVNKTLTHTHTHQQQNHSLFLLHHSCFVTVIGPCQGLSNPENTRNQNYISKDFESSRRFQAQKQKFLQSQDHFEFWEH